MMTQRMERRLALLKQEHERLAPSTVLDIIKEFERLQVENETLKQKLAKCGTSDEPTSEVPDDLYYVVDWTHNDLASFWRPDASGRTVEVNNAGTWTGEELKTAYFRNNPDLMFIPTNRVTEEMKRIVVSNLDIKKINEQEQAKQGQSQ